MKKIDQRGQILLVVILVLVVALTVGLAVASRTITNLKVSKQSEEAQRAFQAAEAGVQEAIKQAEPTPVAGSFTNNSRFSTTVVMAEGTNILLNGGNEVVQDKGYDVWLSHYDPNSNPSYVPPYFSGNVTIYFGQNFKNEEQNCSSTGDRLLPAIEVVMLHTPPGYSLDNPALFKQIFDPCSIGGGSATPGNTRIPGATAAGSGSQTFEGITFNHNTASITVQDGIVMKIIPIFNSTKIAVESPDALPTQGKFITSTGVSGESTKKIIYFVSFPQIPIEIFPYSIISQNQ